MIRDMETLAFDNAFKQRMQLLKTMMEQSLEKEKLVHLSYRIRMTDIAMWAGITADHLMSLHDELLAGHLEKSLPKGKEYFERLDKDIELYSERLLNLFLDGRRKQLVERRKHILIGVGFVIALSVSLYFS